MLQKNLVIPVFRDILFVKFASRVVVHNFYSTTSEIPLYYDDLTLLTILNTAHLRQRALFIGQ